LDFGTCFLRGLRGKWRILGVGWAGGYCHFGLLDVNVVIVDTLSMQETTATSVSLLLLLLLFLLGFEIHFGLLSKKMEEFEDLNANSTPTSS